MPVQVLRKRSELLSPKRVLYLSDEERAQVAELLARLEAECNEDVQRVILYGSKARGDAESESDVDLLVATTNGTDRVKKICYEFEYDNLFIAPMVFSRESWENNQRLKPPFYVNVRRDGIELWNDFAARLEESQVLLDFPEGEPRPLDYETIEVIRLYVDDARRRWKEAKILEREISPLSGLTNAYYAAFNFATAALYTVNVIRSKHKGIEGAISQFLVKPKLVEEEYKNIYVRLFKARVWSDYDKVKKAHANDVSEEEATQLLRDAERFNARMEQFLRERGAMID